MNRRTFIQKTTLVTALGVCFPSELSALNNEELKMWSETELMGLTSRKLKGEDPLILTRKTLKAFNNMRIAAWEDGLVIKPVSSYRSYQRQKDIFESKYDRFIKEGLAPSDALEKIVEYSTIPGTSRHHWGTDIDIIQGGVAVQGDVLLEEHFDTDGAFSELQDWLTDHASKYGFYVVYTNNENRKGFKYEPWHLSYKPESQKALERYLKLNVYESALQQSVQGLEYLDKRAKQRYLHEQILDINPAVLP
ncbi:MAG: M15 family metallopeptidase [Bacteroidetes bacterium]|nr:M15 family metallopeptidase [Bacteroidota bacterium]